MAHEENYSKHKLSALKDLCRERKLATSGTKTVLIGRLTSITPSVNNLYTSPVSAAKINPPSNNSNTSTGTSANVTAEKITSKFPTTISLHQKSIPGGHHECAIGHSQSQTTQSTTDTQDVSTPLDYQRKQAPSASQTVLEKQSESGGDPSTANLAEFSKKRGQPLLTSPISSINEVSRVKRRRSVISERVSATQLDTPKATNSTKAFLTPFKQNALPSLDERSIGPLPEARTEKFTAWNDIDPQLDWFNSVLQNLRVYLVIEEQDDLRLKNLEKVTKPFLESIAFAHGVDQAVACLRFLIARLYNKMSTMEDEGFSLFSVLSISPIIDVEEVIPGICRATLSSNNHVHFIAKTGEIIGTNIPGSPSSVLDGQMNLRGDWQRLVDEHPDRETGFQELVDQVTTSDSDLYPHGISQHFLTDCRDGELIEIAKTYVLANLSPNSTSGRWMSILDSWSEFNGIRTIGSTFVKPHKTPELCLFLPPAHHVEKVYRTTQDGKKLHDGICAIQTANRTHLCLKLTGQVIGNDEEGVTLLWQELLGCDTSGAGCQVPRRSDIDL